MPRPGARPNPNNWYDFGIGSKKIPIGLLRDATALPGSYCTNYSEDIDTVVGVGRDLARDLRTGARLSDSSRTFIDAYNKSVDHMARCDGTDP